jgi:DNA topoisomerase-3
MKTLVLTEKKSVADDFARVLKGFKKRELAYERDELVITWASGHLLELKNPDAYDPKYKRWLLADLPILPEKFEHEPRAEDKRSETLLKHLVKELNRPDVARIVNACDAGREGELIFNLIVEHAKARKPVLRMWLQSMTARAIEAAFEELATANTRQLKHAKADAGRSHETVFPSDDFRNLRDAAYARDEADWLIGMNGTRALTRKFMGRSRNFLAVGRVKTPTLAFLVDREREIDGFVAVPYFQIDATFGSGDSAYGGRWTGQDREGRKTDRLPTAEEAEAIRKKVDGRIGTAEDRETRRKEEPPLLFDLTTLQREASSRYGYTLDRTLRIAQSLYEARKAITYPRTSSRYLPDDYGPEIPRLLTALRHGVLGHAAAQVAPTAKPEVRVRVFNTAKVSDHFALIPTGENPDNLYEDERKIYELITRRFLAVFLPSAEWLNVTRETVVEGETFATRGRRLAVAGWRAVEPATEDTPLPALPSDGRVQTTSVEVLSKETQPPSRYTDGTLVKAMESSGKDVEHGDDLDEETIDEIKEKGIGTPATRASIVKDLIDKRLARREGRSILPSPLGCSLVRLLRNLSLDALARAETTGEWEYRLARMTRGDYTREKFGEEMKQYVQDIVNAVRLHEGGNEEIFARDHGKPPIACPRCQATLTEKTFSYMCPKCELNISKDQSGKYLFPETLRRLLRDKRIGPVTGFERTRAHGFLKLNDAFEVEVELAPSADGEDTDADAGDGEKRYESVPEGTVMGKCPKCKARGVDADVVRSGMGYKCVRNVARAKEKECDFRLAEKIRYRFLPPDQIRKLMAGEKTDYLFGFISRNGKRFQASLHYSPEGELLWEFPPRAPKKPKKTDGAAGEEAAGEEAAAKDDGKKPPPRKRGARKARA